MSISKYLKLASVILTLVIITSAWPGLDRPSAQEPPPSETLDVVLILDQSGSMHIRNDPGTKQKDSQGRISVYDAQDCEFDQQSCAIWKELPLRQVGAKYFIDYLSIDLNNPDHRIGLVYFGEDVATSKKLPLLFHVQDAKTRQEAKKFLIRNVPDMGWTNINLALEEAYNILFNSASQEPARKPVVVLLSDGHPELLDPWPEEESEDPGHPERIVMGKREYYARQKQIIEDFKKKGCPIFMIALGKDAQKTDEYLESHCTELFGKDACRQGAVYRTIWEYAAAETNGEYYKAETANDLFHIYHAIAAKLLGASSRWHSEGNLQGEPETIHIPVGQCSSLVVTVFATDPSTQVTLRNPDEEKVKASVLEKEYRMYTIQNPAPGDWELRFTGGTGRYEIQLDCQETRLRAELLDPASSRHPLCKPMHLQAQVWRENSLADDVGVIVTVRKPDGTDRIVGLTSEGNGLYSGQLPNEDTTREGEYQLKLVARDADLEVTTDKDITVLPLPFLDFVTPVDGGTVPGGDITIQAAIKIGCEPAKDNLTLSSSSDTSVVATLRDMNGNVIGKVNLLDDGIGADDLSVDGLFSGVIQDVKKGEYTLTIDMITPLLDAHDSITGHIYVGDAIPPTPTLIPTITPLPTLTPTPVPPAIGLANSKLRTVRPGRTFDLRLRYNTSNLEDDQTIRLSLQGVPLELKTKDLTLPFGQKGESSVQIWAPENGLLNPEEKEREYRGILIAVFPDGQTKEIPFGVLVRRPISPWPILTPLLVLIVVGIGVVVYFKGIKPKQIRLSGTLIYQQTPPEVSNIPNEPLSGKKHTVILDEITEDLENLHTTLVFVGKPGKRGGARLTIAETNSNVSLNGVPCSKGTSYDLSDGSIISVGQYELRYENLWEENDEPLEGPWIPDDDYGIGDDDTGYEYYEETGTPWDADTSDSALDESNEYGYF